MFRFEGTVRHCLLWCARSHRHDDLRDTTAETYWARALFPPLLLDHAERVASPHTEPYVRLSRIRLLRFRRDPFVRDVVSDPGRASAPCIAVPHMLPSTLLTVSASASFDFVAQ